MTGPISKLTTAAVLAMTLGTAGCIVHDRYHGYRGGYHSGYYRPGVVIHGGTYRHHDRHHYRDHDRRDRRDRHDRYDRDGRWYRR